MTTTFITITHRHCLHNYIHYHTTTTTTTTTITITITTSPLPPSPHNHHHHHHNLTTITEATTPHSCDPAKYPLGGKGLSLEYLRSVGHMRPRSMVVSFPDFFGGGGGGRAVRPNQQTQTKKTNESGRKLNKK
jgi:hypothetical protein